MRNITEKELYEQLKTFFGFDSFKGNQLEIIKALFENRDCFVIMPTGGGKSLCYQLPALLASGTAIIISPLIALMKNQVDAIRNFGTDLGIAHFLNSSLSRGEVRTVKEDLLSGKTKLLYVAPETLIKDENIDFFKEIEISFFAIDEVHCISEWGHDFRPEYRRIREIINKIGHKVPLIALTATATPKVQSDIQKNLKIEKAGLFISSFNRPNLYYEVREKTKDVEKDIVKYIKSHNGKSGIVYCLSRKKVEELAAFLQANNIKAIPYHAGLDSHTRVANQDAFLMEEVDVVVATIAFGMGIDKPDVRFVIHYDMPKSLEGYYQETGRAGRDDGEGNCIAFYDVKDLYKLEKFSSKKTVAEQEIVKQLLAETAAYAESTICRRKHILQYFGEKYKEENCGKCNVCLHPKPKINAAEQIQIAIEVIDAVKQQFQESHIIDILVGKKTTLIVKYKHDKLKQFGEGKDFDEKFWGSVIRIALFEQLLTKDIENYGLLKISKKGYKYLELPYPLQVNKPISMVDEDEEVSDEPMIIAGEGATDKVLFSMLKKLRKDIAQDEGCPPYQIFQDPTLEDMCIQYPISTDEMKHITGVGQGKSKKYSKQFTDLIKQYVEDNEIIRPQDLVVKSVLNKSAIKPFVIQSVDKCLDLEDIASAKGLEMLELLGVMLTIVESGTKLNISYYIDRVIDPYRQEDILDYLEDDSETYTPEEILDELGDDDFSLEDIIMMKIKYLSRIDF